MPTNKKIYLKEKRNVKVNERRRKKLKEKYITKKLLIY